MPWGIENQNMYRGVSGRSLEPERFLRDNVISESPPREFWYELPDVMLPDEFWFVLPDVMYAFRSVLTASYSIREFLSLLPDPSFCCCAMLALRDFTSDTTSDGVGSVDGVESGELR
jgi:hypothetical protein